MSQSYSSGANAPLARNVGIVVVHGVIPHPRYEIQDECAANLRNELNNDANWKGLGKWVTSIYNSPDPTVEKTLKPHPTTSRVRLDGDNPNNPQGPYFDVIESYFPRENIFDAQRQRQSDHFHGLYPNQA